MRNRQHTLIWMKDLIDHMARCQEQLQWAGDGPSEEFLTEALLADLSEFRRLCQELKGKPRRATDLVGATA